MSARVFLIGTDTDAGKTAVTCALLHACREANIRAVPFKPAASGVRGPRADPHRLVEAAQLPDLRADLVCPFTFARALAPGLIEDPEAFTDGTPPKRELGGFLTRAQWQLAQIETRYEAQLTLIEGAGGLYCPMPGGSWLPDWIAPLAASVVLVARAGLGTINHTRLTVEALRAREIPVLGFFTSQLADRQDPSRDTNAHVIAQATGLPLLGALPFLGRPPDYSLAGDWLNDGALELLRRA